MQLGFIIDHTRCIGCHACTVACKAENDVPLGNFRTWVKYTEEGKFPSVKRSFAVLRCNQCTNAPCIEICPVRALEKRPDGVVDVDPQACIGCKACLQGCPYDALYINESSGTAEKCHFCVHRTERGLAPACAVACPTEAIIPGDFHDPDSVVWKMRAELDLQARKVEAGTGPNVLYREVAESGIDPLQTNASGGYLWASQQGGDWLDAERFRASDETLATEVRTTYDVDRSSPWGWKISAYLFTKSLAAGLFLIAGLFLATPSVRTTVGLGAGALVFLLATLALLVADLKQPRRFATILLRPNWSSWIVRGSVILSVYSVLLVVWIAAWLGGAPPWGNVTIYVVGALFAVLTAGYTGWLFGQSKARVLWMRRGLWLHLVVQAVVAGAAMTLLADAVLPLPAASRSLLRWSLVAALALHALFILTESRCAPALREKEYRQVLRLITHGPFAARHYAIGMVTGILLPCILLGVPETGGTWLFAAILVLVGLYVEEDTLVRAGQAQTIS